MKKRLLSLLLALVLVLGLMPVTAMADGQGPERLQESVSIEMKLSTWHELDLSEYFSGSNLTYYRVGTGEYEDTKLSGAVYLYYPAGFGQQSESFYAVDSNGNRSEELTLYADVAVPPNPVKIQFSITEGVDKYYYSENTGAILKPTEVTVPYFDLGLYDLEEYYYNPQCYSNNKPGVDPLEQEFMAGTAEIADGIVTAMHALIYITEVYYMGYEPEDAGKGLPFQEGYEEDKEIFEAAFAPTGGVGSSFTYLWQSTNLNYYMDYKFPYGAPLVGLTSDQQALYGGEDIVIHFIEDLFAMTTGFVFFTEHGYSDTDHQLDEVTVKKGDTLNLTLSKTATFYADAAEPVPYEYASLVWCRAEEFNEDLSTWNEEDDPVEEAGGTVLYDYSTDEEGTVTFLTEYLEPGTYYIGSLGEAVEGFEMSPALVKVTVVGDKPEAPQPPAVTVDTSKLGNLLPNDNITIADGTMTIAPADNTPACMVLVKNGDQYTRVAATKNADNNYNFNVSNLPEGASIVVAVKGDADGDSEITVFDYMAIAQSLLPPAHDSYEPLDGLNYKVSDTDGDDEITVFDYMAIAQSLLQKDHAQYEGISW